MFMMIFLPLFLETLYFFSLLLFMCRNKRTRLLESSSGSWTRSLIQLLGIALIQTFTRPFIVRMKSQPPFFEIFFLPKYFFFEFFCLLCSIYWAGLTSHLSPSLPCRTSPSIHCGMYWLPHSFIS